MILLISPFGFIFLPYFSFRSISLHCIFSCSHTISSWTLVSLLCAFSGKYFQKLFYIHSKTAGHNFHLLYRNILSVEYSSVHCSSATFFLFDSWVVGVAFTWNPFDNSSLKEVRFFLDKLFVRDSCRRLQWFQFLTIKTLFWSKVSYKNHLGFFICLFFYFSTANGDRQPWGFHNEKPSPLPLLLQRQTNAKMSCLCDSLFGFISPTS